MADFCTHAGLPMMATHRRAFLARLSGAALALVPAPIAVAAPPPSRSLHFSLYGMKGLPLVRALPALAQMGYGGVEIAALAGWETDPLTCGIDKRRELRKRLADLGLKLVSVMESLPYTPSPRQRQDQLDRLKRATELAQHLDPAGKPLIETILGGKPGEIEQHRAGLLMMLESWDKALEPIGGRVALKAHRLQMVTDHEELAKLIAALPAPRLHAAFDPSHQPDPQADCAGTLQKIGGRLAFIHIKDIDWRQSPTKDAQFALPGRGKVGWPSFFAALGRVPAEVPVCVEVSRQIWDRPGYDPLEAARLCRDFWQKWIG